MLVLGERTPAFDLLGTDGRRYSLDSFSPDALLVVLFLADHCPHVAACEEEIVTLAIEHAGWGASFLGVSSSDSGRYPEDSLEGMTQRAQHAHYPFPYLFDADASVARSFGAEATPEVFVFDRHRRLRYRGAIRGDDSAPDDGSPHLSNAIEALLRDDTPPVTQTRPLGCPIEGATPG